MATHVQEKPLLSGYGIETQYQRRPEFTGQNPGRQGDASAKQGQSKVEIRQSRRAESGSQKLENDGKSANPVLSKESQYGKLIGPDPRRSLKKHANTADLPRGHAILKWRLDTSPRGWPDLGEDAACQKPASTQLRFINHEKVAFGETI